MNSFQILLIGQVVIGLVLWIYFTVRFDMVDNKLKKIEGLLKPDPPERTE